MTLDAAQARLEIAAECDALRAMLQAKNEKYGNSVFEPSGVFSDASPLELIAVRIDDKIARLREARSRRREGLPPVEDEDVVLDLLGYLVLYRIGQRVLK